MTAREVLLAYANDWHRTDCAGNFSPFAECSCELAEWVTKAEAEATAAAEQRLRAAEVVVEAARAAWKAAYFSGPEIGDLEVALAAYDSDAPAPREPEYPQPGCSCEPCQRAASPRQGEPVERLPVLMLFEGWADLLPVGTCWRIAEVRTHVEPSGVKDELGKAQSVIRFDPAPAALSEPAEAGEL